MDYVLKFLAEPFAGSTTLEFLIKIADIVIVAYILYRVLLMVRGTRTLAMAIGFAAIYLIYLFSEQFGLATLSNLFDVFFSKLSIFVIFVLIIFQDDIRRALGRMGTFRRSGPIIQVKAIEEVVQAAGALASKRIGAIIIFEGKADLDAFASEGVEVDSALTREALFSIFIPSFENPLHDGAVVIRNFRIYKAAVIIRHLTPRSDLPKDLGTRHRAAIGITEDTDGVAIVVSEETGSISACFNGNLVQSVSMADLRRLLDVKFRRKERAEKSVWNFWGAFQKRRKARPTIMVTKEKKGTGAKDGGGKKGKDKDAKKKGDSEASLDDPEVFAEFLGSK